MNRVLEGWSVIVSGCARYSYVEGVLYQGGVAKGGKLGCSGVLAVGCNKCGMHGWVGGWVEH